MEEKRWDLAKDVAREGFGVSDGVVHATHTDHNNWLELKQVVDRSPIHPIIVLVQKHKSLFVLFYTTWCEHCDLAKT